MQLTGTAYVDSLNTYEDGWGKTHRSCQKHGFQSLRDTSFFFFFFLTNAGCHLEDAAFITNLNKN
jgi:hypothetical protein